VCAALALQKDGQQLLLAHLASHVVAGATRDELKRAIGEVIAKVKEQGVTRAVVTAAQIDSAIASLTSAQVDLSSVRVVDVISAYEHPRFHFDGVRKTIADAAHRRTKFGTPDDKANMLRERYELMLQRMQRRPEFQPPAPGAARSRDATEVHAELCSIESLMGQSQETRCTH
jgi:hypothetical protein